MNDFFDSLDCPRFEEQASDFLEGRLPDAAAAAMRQHARQCPACGRLLEGLHSALDALADLPMPELPPDFIPTVLARTSGQRQNLAGWGPTLRSLGRMLWQPRFAMGLALAWFSLALLLNVSGTHLNRIHAADLAPARWPSLVSRTVRRVYARGVRYYNDLRVVYEIQAALHAGSRQSSPVPPAHPSGQSQRPPYNWNPGTRTLARTRPAVPPASLTGWSLARIETEPDWKGRCV